MTPAISRKTTREYRFTMCQYIQMTEDKRDCLAWSVLHGANTSYRVSARLSKWSIPFKYYVSFPYGIYNPSVLREKRDQISSNESFFVSYENKTVRDGEYLGFTFGEEEYKKYRDHLKKTSTGAYEPAETGRIPNRQAATRRKILRQIFFS
jgi:hypothetical protein